MADNRTMAQMLQAPIEGYEDAIVVPPINANSFELKQTLINLVQSNQFTGRQDPHNHLRFFNKVTSTFRHPEVPNTTVKLLLFPFSLEGEARIWLDKEPPRSILTWEDLVSKFINQFFPPSKTTYLQLHQLDTFYNALNPNDQDALDSAAGGNFLDKIPRECVSIIESKSKVRYSRSRVTDVRGNTNAPLSSSSQSNSFDLQQIAAALKDKLDIEAIRNNTKIVNNNNEEDESIEVDEVVNIKESKNHPLDKVIENLNQRTLRSQAQNHSNFFCFISTIKPKDVKEALKDKSWVVAMQEELNHFVANDVWDLVPLPMSQSVIGTKWVFRNKLVENGILSRNKARLDDSKLTKTSMSTKIKLTKDDEADSVDSTKYLGLEPFLTHNEPICPRFVVKFYHSLEVKRDEEECPYIEFKLGQFTFKLTSSQLSRIFQTSYALETFYISEWSLNSLDDHPNSNFFGLKGCELFFKENFFYSLGKRNRVNACTAYMLYYLTIRRKFNFTSMILYRMEEVKNKCDGPMPFAMLLTRLYNHILETNPQTIVPLSRFTFHERVIDPLDISRNPSKEKGKRVASPSITSSLSLSSDDNEGPSFLEFYDELSDNEDLTKTQREKMRMFEFLKRSVVTITNYLKKQK
nr:retrovirus-related Pol polyprotein from transposon TNT 1-94 [Tanacetum cinerariifolium]